MDKAGFVELVKEAGEFETKKEAEVAVNAFVKAVEKALSKKEEVVLVGFGKFEAVVQKGREGKVPGSTHKTFKTEDVMVPKFKPGKSLKELVAKIKVKK